MVYVKTSGATAKHMA